MKLSKSSSFGSGCLAPTWPDISHKIYVCMCLITRTKESGVYVNAMLPCVFIHAASAPACLDAANKMDGHSPLFVGLAQAHM